MRSCIACCRDGATDAVCVGVIPYLGVSVLVSPSLAYVSADWWGLLIRVHLNSMRSFSVLLFVVAAIFRERCCN